jgi:hypothetical protein
MIDLKTRRPNVRHDSGSVEQQAIVRPLVAIRHRNAPLSKLRFPRGTGVFSTASEQPPVPSHAPSKQRVFLFSITYANSPVEP